MTALTVVGSAAIADAFQAEREVIWIQVFVSEKVTPPRLWLVSASFLAVENAIVAR